jgi:hypothetical protein
MPRSVRIALGACLGTRLPVLFVGFMSVVLFGYPGGDPPTRVFSNELWNLQARWDSGWYLGIAVNGYDRIARSSSGSENVVFFPALPLLMRAIHWLVGGSQEGLVLGSTLALLAAFFGALVYLFCLSREMLADDDRAAHAVWLLAAFPFAVFYGAIYTESLFLLSTLGALYHFRREQFLRAASWGLVVGLTRPNGSVLSLVLALLALGRLLRLPGIDRSNPAAGLDGRGRIWLTKALGAAAAPILGLLMYCAFMWQHTGDPFAWVAMQTNWGRRYEGLWTLGVEHYRYIAERGLYAYATNLPIEFLQGLGVLFVLASAIGVAHRLGIAYALYVLMNILPPLATGGLLSAGRFTSVLFPSFIWMASWVPAAQRTVWIAGFMAVQSLIAALFYTWRGMY